MCPAIQVSNLSKLYRLGARQQAYHTLRESIVEAVAAPFQRLRELFSRPTVPVGEARIEGDAFWALRDVSFDIHPGEVVGVIGRNGAGKSTLLKIISRITEPTSGRVVLKGRVGSLLEVGTGFHPELTGRENIFMNGSILGMSRREIAQKFDEIVAFSEVDDFLDTPVKRYSSGMYVRLAFAVAAHLEPEILIVDEVLAVGDAAFQRKCLGRMREVSKHGRTVIFVSHNMAAIETLCNQVIYLDGGKLVNKGDTKEQIQSYYQHAEAAAAKANALANVGGKQRPNQIIHSIAVVNEDGEVSHNVRLGGKFSLRLKLTAPAALEGAVVGVGFDDTLEQRALSVLTPLTHGGVNIPAGTSMIECNVPNFPLAPGDYWLKVVITARGSDVDTLEKGLRIHVYNAHVFEEGRGHHRGYCVAQSTWRYGSESDLPIPVLAAAEIEA